MNNIYFDYAASSLKHFDIYKEVISEIEDLYANPSSNHTLGKKNASLLTKARKNIATFINTTPDQIIFTSGGTEANNMVFNHIAKNFSSGEIIISNIEHPSVYEAAISLEKVGFKVIELPVNSGGRINIDDLKNTINKNTVLISIMFANNETGIINPIKEIGQLAKEYNILFHSDIVQAFGKTKIDIKELNIDFASVSAHKIGATNNFGFLYSKLTSLSPLIIGGGQENGLRSGTSDIFGALVLEKCTTKTYNDIEKIKELKNYLLEKLDEQKISYEINGDIKNSLPNILNIYLPNIQSQRIITFLDTNNIYISGGSACSSGNIKGSKIIAKMYDEYRAERSVRISIGFDTTKEKIDIFVDKIKNLEHRILERSN